MKTFLYQPMGPRVLTALAAIVLALLLTPFSGWFLLLFAPFVTYAIIGFRLTRRRVALRACLMPRLMLLPLIVAAWISSHQRMMYCLVSLGENRVAGFYLFPGVVEAGVYRHDPAGLKYLREGVSDDIADVMTEDVRRFQRYEGSEQVYDCICFNPIKTLPRFNVFECRNIPVINGWGAVGSIYAGLRGDGGWTNSDFYVHAGRWTSGFAYSSYHVGFHFIALCLLAAIPYVTGLRRWRRYENRLNIGLCVGCGYDLRGSAGDRCSECGAKIERALVNDQVDD
ncbi:MAG TPA: hypothetical protein P5572_03630 [Phycisphaerae bacterium]|nr:hypothetical protein [Phycisphaerales bacterium]HRX84089.1 hypothetical protein [Phycisphaerae bacterium]